jgi:hypothetical protein
LPLPSIHNLVQQHILVGGQGKGCPLLPFSGRWENK